MLPGWTIPLTSPSGPQFPSLVESRSPLNATLSRAMVDSATPRMMSASRRNRSPISPPIWRTRLSAVHRVPDHTPRQRHLSPGQHAVQSVLNTQPKSGNAGSVWPGWTSVFGVQLVCVPFIWRQRRPSYATVEWACISGRQGVHMRGTHGLETENYHPGRRQASVHASCLCGSLTDDRHRLCPHHMPAGRPSLRASRLESPDDIHGIAGAAKSEARHVWEARHFLPSSSGIRWLDCVWSSILMGRGYYYPMPLRNDEVAA